MNNGIFGHNRMYDKPKFKLHLTDREMDLLLKCIVIGYKYGDELNVVFKINQKDKDKLFYLHRVLSCKANEFFYNKINNNFFVCR